MESHTIGEEGVIKSQANTVFVAEKFSRDFKFIYLHEQVVVKFNKRQLRGAWRGIYMIPKPYWLRKYVIKNMVFPEKLVQRFDTRVSDNQGRIYNVYRAEWRFLMAQPFMTLLADGLDSLATTLATPGYPMERITSDAQKLRTALSSPSFSESLESVATGLVELYELFDNLVIRLEEADNSGEGFSTETSSDFINHFLYAQEIIQYSTEGLHDLIRLNENLPQNLLSIFISINPANTLEPDNSSKYIEKPTSQGTLSTLEKDISTGNYSFEKGGIPLSKILEAEPKEFSEKESTGVDGFDWVVSILGMEKLLAPFQKKELGVKGTWIRLFNTTLIAQKEANLTLFKNTGEDMLSLLHKMIIQSPKFKQEAIETGIIVDDTANNQVSTQDKVQKAIDSTAIIKGFKEPNISKKSTKKDSVKSTPTKQFQEIAEIVDSKEFDRVYDIVVSTMEYVNDTFPDDAIKGTAIGLTNKYQVLNIYGEDAVKDYVIAVLKNGYDMSREPWLESYIKNTTQTIEPTPVETIQQAFTPPVVNNVETQDSKTFSEISDIVDSKEFDRLYDRIVSTMEYSNNTSPINVISGITTGLTNTYSSLNMFGEEAVKEYVITVLKNGYNMSQDPWLESYIKNIPDAETVTQQSTQQEINKGVTLPINEADSITRSVSQQVPQHMAEVTGMKDSAGEALDKNDKAPGSGAKTAAPKDSDRIDAEDETTDYEIVEDEFPEELALEIVDFYNEQFNKLNEELGKNELARAKATKLTVDKFKNKVPKDVHFDGLTVKQLVDAVKESDRESLHQEITSEFATQEYDEMADIDSSEDVPVDAETWKKGQPIVVKVINWEEFQKTEEVFNNGVGSSPPASDHTIVLSPEVTIDKALAKRMLDKYEREHKSLLRELYGEFGYVKTAHSKAIKLVMDDFKGDKRISQIAKNAGGFASLVHLIQKYFDNQTDHR